MDYPSLLIEMRQLCAPTIEPGLERIEALLAELGHPERELRAIHVAGTNGKGSVCAMLDSILLADGFRTARFTSPHLHDYRERCLIDGNMLSEQQTAKLLQVVNEAMRRLVAKGGPRPTEFEASTAMSLLAAAEAEVEWLVLEVGLGGRFDATNVVNAPIAVITNIGRDHMEYLGDTIAQIAAEKAGIIKPGAYVFSGATGEASEIIRAEAARQNARLHFIGQDIHAQICGHDATGQTINIQTPLSIYPGLWLPLLGAHQGLNAALAVSAAEAAGAEAQSIRSGLPEARHMARLEILNKQPLIVLDGAHNVPGIATLARALEDYWPGQRRLALIGMLADKEREQALSLLLPHIHGAVISCPPIISRSEGWQNLAAFCADEGLAVPPENIIKDIPAACEHALQLLPEYDMLLVCGSLYLVAEARAYLKEWSPKL